MDENQNERPGGKRNKHQIKSFSGDKNPHSEQRRAPKIEKPARKPKRNSKKSVSQTEHTTSQSNATQEAKSVSRGNTIGTSTSTSTSRVTVTSTASVEIPKNTYFVLLRGIIGLLTDRLYLLVSFISKMRVLLMIGLFSAMGFSIYLFLSSPIGGEVVPDQRKYALEYWWMFGGIGLLLAALYPLLKRLRPLVSSFLYKAYMKLAPRYAKPKNPKYKNFKIFSEYLKHRKQETSATELILIITVLILGSGVFLFSINTTPLIIAVIALLIINRLSQAILNKRIHARQFGNHISEAIEIIAFVESKKPEIPSGGGGPSQKDWWPEEAEGPGIITGLDPVPNV